jgi:tetratricopeptide (TPR) repeat protein
MPHFFCSRLLPVILCLALFSAREVSAQIDAPSLIEEVDPDTEPVEEDDSVYEDEEPTPRRPGKKPPRGKNREPVEEEEPEAAVPTPTSAPPASPTPPTATPPSTPTPEATPTPTPAPTPPAPVGTRSAPPLLAPRVSDADLLAVWERWKQARASGDAAAAEQGRKALLKLRDEVSASDFDAFSVSLLREARERRDKGDLKSAVQLAEAAATLSPNLPYARFALADVYARQQMGAVNKYVPEIQAGISALMNDPRYQRPAIADAGAMALLAVLATAVAVVAVLFGRRVRYFLHDFHHVFPRGMGRWQSLAVAVTVLAMPLLLGLGVVPVLLVFFGAVVLYLSVAERAVAAVLLALVGLIPLAAGHIARSTVFAGTVAEDVYVLERGGFAGDDAAARVLARQAAKEATFAELFALGRYLGRRGQLEEAEQAFKAASTLRQRSGPLLTNYANVLLAAGRGEEAERIYKEASQADSTLAAAHYNLAQLYRHRAKGMPDNLLGAEMDRHREALASAHLLDNSLVGREVPPDDRMLVNLLLLSPALSRNDIMVLANGDAAGERVEAQLNRVLLGATGTVALVYPAVLALLLFLFGYARDRLRAVKSCEKCGNVVCRRCDPDLSAGSFMCSQCTNVFARKGVVPEPLRLQKQAEVQRHQTWMNRLALGLGALVSGAGHLFSGAPIRGAIYSFLFLLALAVVVLRDGLLKAPYGDAPVYLKVLPVVVVLLPLYLLSLRGLRKRQTQ